jgi:RNA polymerase sigma-70 factor (ECF subfamily)
MTQIRPVLTLLHSTPDASASDPTGAATPAAVGGHWGNDGAADDLSLLRRVHAGDAAALDALLREYWAPLLAYVARLLASEDRAQDVVQEVFIRVWEGRARLEVDGGVRPLLYRIARNLALNERRSDRVRDRWREAEAHDTADRVRTPLHTSIFDELERAVERALDALPPRRREAFVLARFHDMSHRQIASVMGVSAQTVANQISGALTDLRRALEPYVEVDRSRGA